MSFRDYFVIDCNGCPQYTYDLRSRGVQCPNSPLSGKADLSTLILELS